MSSWRLLSPLCLATWVLGVSTAFAGPLETLRSIAFHPTDPETFALVYNEAGGGLLITHDGGQSFEMACMSFVMGERTTDSLLPGVVFSADGHLVVATFYGLFRGDSRGCGFQRVPEFGEHFVAGVTADPAQPSTLYALTSSGGEQNGIFRSLDEGATWSPFGQLENAYFRALFFAPLPAGGRRMVVSLAKLADEGFALTPVVRISDDEGATFREHAFEDGTDLTLVGVDARDPSRFYATAPDATGKATRVLMNAMEGQPGAWQELGAIGSAGSFTTLAEGGFLLVDMGVRQLMRLNAEGTGLELVDAYGITYYGTSPLTGEHYSGSTFRLHGAMANGLHTDEIVYDMNQADALVSCGEPKAQPFASCLEQLDFGWCGVTHFPEAPLCQAARGEPDAGVEDPPKRPDACALAHQAGSSLSWWWASIVALSLVGRRRTRMS